MMQGNNHEKTSDNSSELGNFDDSFAFEQK